MNHIGKQRIDKAIDQMFVSINFESDISEGQRRGIEARFQQFVKTIKDFLEEEV